MSFRYRYIALASCLFDAVSADRYEVLEDVESFESLSSNSNGISSRSLYKSAGFVLSWLVAILILRIMVLVTGKMIACCGDFVYKWRERFFPPEIPGRRKVKRRSASDSSYMSLGSLSELLHFDDVASGTTGDSYSYYTSCSDDSVYDEDSTTLSRSSYLSRSSLFTSVFLREKTSKQDKSKCYQQSTDEEDCSKLGHSTVASIRSRFTNGGNTHLATVNDLSNLQPSKKSALQSAQSRTSIRQNCRTFSESIKPKNSDAIDRRERYNVYKQEVKSKESPPSQKRSLEKHLSNHLQNQKRSEASITDTISLSKISMEEVDLNSLVSR